MNSLVALLVCAAPASAPPAPAPAAAEVLHGIDSTMVKRSVAPGDDFFAYSNGAWLDSAPIPDDRSSWGVGDELVEAARKHTVELIQQAAAGATDAEARQVGDLYASFMDEASIEKKGLEPLKTQLAAINAIADKKQLARALGASMRADVDALNSTDFYTPHLLGVWVVQALDDPKTNAPYLLQGGLGLPDREYYVSEKPDHVETRKKYQQYLIDLFKLAQLKDPEGRAKRVMAFETKLATHSASRLESEDMKAVQVWSRDELAKKAPGLDWPVFLEAASLQQAPRFFMWQPKAVTARAALVASEPLNTWKEWLTARLLAEYSTVLPKAFVDLNFALYGKTLQGTPQLAERWKRGVDLTSRWLGEAVGKLYVQKYFAGDAKAKAKAMVDAVVKAFGARVERLSWMSPATKAKAKEKLATLRVGVGYPDTWVDYTSLTIAKDDALGNVQRASQFEYRRALAKLGQPVDRDEWWMTPQTVNAVNLPLQNALNFPAAILQPPFFDPRADPAVNFGAIGSVIGHEISHSFDDSGSQFDAKGQFINWWTDDDLKHFKDAAEQLAAQYDAYEPLPGLHLNGHQVLSENIADVAGLASAYDAYKATTAATPNRAAEQMFFIAFAQAWRDKQREPALRQQVITDGHSPAEYRADTVRNLDAWYAAFDVKPTQKLALPPAQRVRVW